MDRGNENTFFQVLFNDDIWKELKKWMFPGKKTSNFYNYRNGAIAVYYGYLQLIKENNNLIFSNDRYFPSAIDTAASIGRLDIIQYLFSKGINYCTYLAINIASAYGYLDIVKFLHKEVKANYTIFAINHAAANGHLDILKFLHNNIEDNLMIEKDQCLPTRELLILQEQLHYPLNPNQRNWSMNLAIRENHLEVVKFLKTEGKNFPNTSGGCIEDVMIMYGEEINSYKYVERPTNSQKEIYSISLAIKYGHLEIIKFLYRHSFAHLVEHALYTAIYYQQSEELINFLHVGFNVDYDLLVDCAIKNYCPIVVEYLYNKVSMFNIEGAIYKAMQHCQHNIYQTLIKNIFRDGLVQEVIERAERKGYNDVVNMLTIEHHQDD